MNRIAVDSVHRALRLPARREADTQREAMELLRAVVENSRELISTADADGTLLFVSPSHKAIMGYEPGELEGTTIAQWVHPEDLAKLKLHLEELAAHPNERRGSEALRFRHKDGCWRILGGTSSRLSPGSALPGVILTNAWDITERKQRESELRDRHAVLSVIVWWLSHDAKTPVNGAALLASDVARRLKGKIPADVYDDLCQIVDLCVGAETELINIFEKFAPLDPAKRRLPPQPVHTARVVAKVIGMLRPAAFHKGVAIEVVSELPDICGWEDALAGVFRNLVENGIKHMDKHAGWIRIAAEVVGLHATFVVEDNGPGIPCDKRDDIFRRSCQVRERRTPGTGNGLAIVRHLVEAMKGCAWFEPSANGGSRFCFQLPLAIE